MPYGTYAEVGVQRLWRDLFLNIRVQPSSEDKSGKSAGLCGTLDNNRGNDFQPREGTKAGITFSRSWVLVHFFYISVFVSVFRCLIICKPKLTIYCMMLPS